MRPTLIQLDMAAGLRDGETVKVKVKVQQGHIVPLTASQLRQKALVPKAPVYVEVDSEIYVRVQEKPV